jgi:hypothetical protein
MRAASEFITVQRARQRRQNNDHKETKWGGYHDHQPHSGIRYQDICAWKVSNTRCPHGLHLS